MKNKTLLNAVNDLITKYPQLKHTVEGETDTLVKSLKELIKQIKHDNEVIEMEVDWSGQYTDQSDGEGVEEDYGTETFVCKRMDLYTKLTEWEEDMRDQYDVEFDVGQMEEVE